MLVLVSHLSDLHSVLSCILRACVIVGAGVLQRNWQHPMLDQWQRHSHTVAPCRAATGQAARSQRWQQGHSQAERSNTARGLPEGLGHEGEGEGGEAIVRVTSSWEAAHD